ncbi:rifin PIR protein, putative [Plasmodium sp. DRC-Itaito]|nr:rifin PIR protein, putative [Plasmodium sp. DRC-Itaito]
MNLQYSKILLFFLQLSILVTSYHVHNKNKVYITTNHTQTNRSLCECDAQSSIYDNDVEIKSVKEQFDDRTSERLREYDERMKEKRQKCKEQRDKNIQQIIEEDKREKSLAEKIEIGCLRCGCGLGGVAASVGVFGGLGIYGSEMDATAVAAKAGGIKKGLQVGLTQVIEEVKQLLTSGQEAKIPPMEELAKMTTDISGDNLTFYDIIQCINSNIKGQWGAKIDNDFSLAVDEIAKKPLSDLNLMHGKSVEAVASAFEKGKADAIITTHAEYTHLYSAIGYSFLAILLIVVVMIIIYLVLRYRRKKKMKKKAEYTKLLNQ